MASEPHPAVFDEKNCQCLICIEILNDPKLLPCLHRFCNNCLQSLMENEQETFRCPECKEEYEVSRMRENGLKDDIYMANVIECIRIRESLQDDATKECFDCCKQAKMAAYCFKCKENLCEKCYQHHVSSKILKDHRKHTVTLKDLGEDKISMEKYLSLKEAPKCYIHTKTVSQLCCITCGNQTICEACTYGEHMGHNLREVTTLANYEREKLSKELEVLDAQMKNFDTVQDSLEKLKQEVDFNVKEKRYEAQLTYDSKFGRVKKKIMEVRKQNQVNKTKVADLEKNYFKNLERQKNKEIKKIKQRYESLAEKKRKEFSNFQLQYEKQLTVINQSLEKREKVFQNFLALLEKNKKENFQKICDVGERWANKLRLAKHLTSMASNITSSKDDWLAIKCIPTVNNAIEYSLMWIKLPEIDNIPLDYINKAPSFDITKKNLLFESYLDIQVIEANSWSIQGVTSSGDGNIVISGSTENGHEPDSFISVIDTEGKTVRKDKMKNIGSWMDYRYCAVLSKFKIATVCSPNEIGIYDVRDGTYVKKHIRHNTKSKTENNDPSEISLYGPTFSSREDKVNLKCVATDLETKQILVGFENIKVHVYDDQLNYLHPIKLPEVLKSLDGMIVSKGNLFICDRKGEKVYVVKMTESEGTLSHEIPVPTLDSGDWKPQGSMCKDSKGFIYVMWSTVKAQIVVKYNEDGRTLLTTKRVNKSSFCMTTFKRGETEQLFVVTDKFGSHTLSVYQVNGYDICSDIKPFVEVLTLQHPELNSASNTPTRKRQVPRDTATQNKDTTSEKSSKRTIGIQVIEANSWSIQGITSSGDGNIVISGNTGIGLEPDSFISVIDTEGKTVRKDKMKNIGSWMDYRYCAVLSKFKIATVCLPNEIGIYDVRDGTYVKKHIRHNTKSKTENNDPSEISLYGQTFSSREDKVNLKCVATDLETKQILVGFENIKVHVYDDQLNYLHPIKLPEVIKSLDGMIVSKGNLFICDRKGEKVYVVKMTESEGTLSHEIPVPTLDSGDWIPQGSMCKDSKGFIYVMWSTVKAQIVVKYNEDGRTLLTKRRVNNSALCMTTRKRVGDTEELLLAFGYSGILEALEL